MSFEQDMQSMSPAQVKEAVQGRLLEGKGTPWVESMDEPVWALLQSSFGVWRETSAQLAAFEEALSATLPQTIKERHWLALQATTELMLSLATDHRAWQPSALTQWPFARWLFQPPAGKEQALAWAALLRLAQLAGWHDPQWVKEQFASVVRTIAQTPNAVEQHLPWLQALWAQCIADTQQDPVQWPWFDMWRSLFRIPDEKARLRSVDVALARARDWMNTQGARQATKTLQFLGRPDFEKQVLPRMRLHWLEVKEQASFEQDGLKLLNLTSRCSSAMARIRDTQSAEQANAIRPHRETDLCLA